MSASPEVKAGCGDVSTLLGAPPKKWRKREMDTMVQVHACYRAAFGNNKNYNILPGSLENDKKALETTGEPQGVDTSDVNDDKNMMGGLGSRESFLAKNSVLRSLEGYGREPANCPFIDDRAFRSSTEMAYWRDQFVNGQSHNRFMSEIAQTCVGHICVSQAQGLRARNGSIPLGSILREKRGHIVPLTLVLHEMKLWLVNDLRTYSVFEVSTFTQIAARIRYLEMLQQPKVWGPVKYYPRSGMRSSCHDHLFRTLLTLKEDLKKAHDYSYRGYCRRSSREKLGKLNELLKSTVFAVLRLLSGLFETSARLSDPSHSALQPLDLMSSWANQRFVNYDNFTHVLLYAILQIPLFKASVLSDYENMPGLDDDSGDMPSALALNPDDIKANKEGSKFKIPGISKKSDKLRIAVVYDEAAATITAGLARDDPHHKPPPKGSQVRKNLLTALGGHVEDAQQLIDNLMHCLCALQDMAPCMYVVFQLWEMAGQGGDFILFDTMRTNTIDVMSTTEKRLEKLQSRVGNLLQAAENLKRVQQEKSDRERLVKRRAIAEPIWPENVRIVQHEHVGVFRNINEECIMQLREIARDAKDYSLTADQLNKRVKKLRALCDALVSPNPDASMSSNPQQA